MEVALNFGSTLTLMLKREEVFSSETWR